VHGEVTQVVLDKNGDLYVQAEVVDNTVADNEESKFTFDNDDVKRAVITDLTNKPYVLTEKLYHPDYTVLNPNVPDDQWLKTYFQWQEDFAIGRVRKVFEASKGVWRAWLHVTNPVAKEAYLLGKIPKKVSIGFFSDDWKMVDGVKRIFKAKGLHIAAVLKGAWKNAVIKNECVGDDSCMSQVYHAGIPNCGFCVKTVLNNLKPEDCFDSNSNSQKGIFQGSVMLDLTKLTDDEKKKLLEELQKGAETPPPETPADKPADKLAEKPSETESKKKGAPLGDKGKDVVDNSQDVKSLQEQLAILQKEREAEKADKAKELTAVREGMVDSFLANETDEEMKKIIKEKAMALPTNDDVKFWLSLKYAQAIELTTPGTKKGKVGHAGVITEIPEQFIDTRAVMRAKQNNNREEFSPSVYHFGED
jgi:hypothetical protein